MCTVIYQPKGKTVPLANHEESVRANKDGWGFAFIEETTHGPMIVVQRGMDNAKYATEAAKVAGKEAVFHCRIATHGEKNVENAHPFKIRPPHSPSVYLFHNGVLRIRQTIDAKMSDSFHFAKYLERTNGLADALQDSGFLGTLEDIIGSSNKLVLMSIKGVSIVNPNAGTWREGVWYSNHNAFPPQKWERKKGQRSFWVNGEWKQLGDDDEDDEIEQFYGGFHHGSRQRHTAGTHPHNRSVSPAPGITKIAGMKLGDKDGVIWVRDPDVTGWRQCGALAALNACKRGADAMFEGWDKRPGVHTKYPDSYNMLVADITQCESDEVKTASKFIIDRVESPAHVSATPKTERITPRTTMFSVATQPSRYECGCGTSFTFEQSGSVLYCEKCIKLPPKDRFDVSEAQRQETLAKLKTLGGPIAPISRCRHEVPLAVDCIQCTKDAKEDAETDMAMFEREKAMADLDEVLKEEDDRMTQETLKMGEDAVVPVDPQVAAAVVAFWLKYAPDVDELEFYYESYPDITATAMHYVIRYAQSTDIVRAYRDAKGEPLA